MEARFSADLVPCRRVQVRSEVMRRGETALYVLRAVHGVFANVVVDRKDRG